MIPIYVAAAILGLISLLLIIRYPMFGLLLIIVVNPLDFLLAEKAGLLVGRPLGILVALGWLATAVVNRRTNLVAHGRLNLMFLAYAVVMLVSTLNSRHPETGLPQVLTISLQMLMGVFLQDFIRTRDDLKRLIWVVALSIGLSGLVGLIQFRAYSVGEEMIGVVTPLRQGVRFAGFRENPNGYAAMLLTGLPFIFLLAGSRSRLVKALMVVLGGVCAVATVLTASRTHVVAMVGFVVAFVAVRYVRRGQLLLTVFILAALAGLVLALWQLVPAGIIYRLSNPESYGDGSTIARISFFYKAIDLWLEYPVVGIGLGNFMYFPPYLGMGEHDQYTFSLAATGTVGALLLLAIIVTAFGYGLKAISIHGARRDPLLLPLSEVIVAAMVAQMVGSAGNIIVMKRMFWINIVLTSILARAHAFRLGEAEPASRPDRGATEDREPETS